MANFSWNGQGGRHGIIMAIREGGRDGVATAGIRLQSTIKHVLKSSGSSNIGNGGRASPPGEPPATDTGSLGRSIQIDMTNLNTNPSRPRVRVGTKLPYARIHEYGGIITAKGGKYLPVPFPGNEAEAKRARRQAGSSLRNLPNLFFIRSARGTAMLVRSNPDGSWEPLFLLVKTVRIPPRPYFRRAYAQVKHQMQQDVLMGIRKRLHWLRGSGG